MCMLAVVPSRIPRELVAVRARRGDLVLRAGPGGRGTGRLLAEAVAGARQQTGSGLRPDRQVPGRRRRTRRQRAVRRPLRRQRLLVAPLQGPRRAAPRSGERNTHHTHPFNGPLSRTTRVSRYQKGKTNLDFTKARDSGSGIGWATCKSAPRSRQITTPTPHHSVFTGRMPFLPPNQQRQSTEGISTEGIMANESVPKIVINNYYYYTRLTASFPGQPG